MRRSQMFAKTRKTVPADETAKNAKLLIQAGFVHKEMAGVYAYLPLGLQVIENIKTIVREEMNAVQGEELIMTGLQRKDVWESTGRWDDEVVDIWFKSALKSGTEVGFGWSHEEPITDMMKNYITSYQDLPVYVYQFQTKLRNELRSKSGIMRGREFVMNDMYSYAADEANHIAFYDRVKQAYMRVFERVGLGDKTYMTFASGGAFTQYSHEFQTISEAGEDIIYLHKDKNIAINEEVLNDTVLADLGIKRNELELFKSAEVGNIFNFGTSKCEAMGLYFTDSQGKQKPVFLGSYGIGITRLMGVIVECFADEKGLVWPEAITPAKVYLARLGDGANVIKNADELYNRLTVAGVAVLYDDRDTRPGDKFADADLMGIPYRVVVSEKTAAADTYELKARLATDTQQISQDQLIKLLGNA